jgi:hypothetical protein
VRLIVHVRLPKARRTRIARQLLVRQKAKLALERRLGFTLVSARSGEERATELGLEEDLGIKDSGRRIERNAVERRVDVIRTSDGVAV